MSITDELREYAGNFYLFRYKDVREKLDAIADRIDAEYEKSIVDALLNDGIPATDENMAEHGWVRLPVDADGEYIHIGNVMDSDVDYLFDGKPFKVCALVLCEDGWEAADGRFGNRYKPDSLRHHHEPTVEDVLQEFAEKWSDMTCGSDEERELFAEYAAKLRLAEGECA